jgi:hypothetical protein
MSSSQIKSIESVVKGLSRPQAARAARKHYFPDVEFNEVDAKRIEKIIGNILESIGVLSEEPNA